MRLNASFNKKNILIFGLSFLGLFLFVFLFFFSLGSVSASSEIVKFQIKSGESFNDIVSDLSNQNLIRSSLAFKIFSVLSGSAKNFKPGDYDLRRNLDSPQISEILRAGNLKEIAITIPEGTDLMEIDRVLSANQIIAPGALINYNRNLISQNKKSLEGRLFPDTYKFFLNSNISEVIGKFSENFANKVMASYQNEPNFEEKLILASLLEKEASDFSDRRLIAGILKKRLSNKILLQVDAAVCYAKEIIFKIPYGGCEPLTPSDLKIASPYNTYLNFGLPPTPITNPGIMAIKAAISPQNSNYWFYISNPQTKRIIFAKTYEEHKDNINKYLRKGGLIPPPIVIKT